MIKNIDIPIYRGRLILIQKKKLENISKEYKPDFDLHGFEACVVCKNEKNGYRNFIMLFEKPTNSRIIAHESLHILSELFKHRGIDISYTNDEHGAYFLGWVVEQCHKYLKINDKNL